MKPNYYRQIKFGEKEREWKPLEQKVKKVSEKGRKSSKKKGNVTMHS